MMDSKRMSIAACDIYDKNLENFSIDLDSVVYLGDCGGQNHIDGILYFLTEANCNWIISNTKKYTTIPA